MAKQRAMSLAERQAWIDVERRQLVRHEAAARAILADPADPRRLIAEQVLRLIEAARGTLEALERRLAER